MKRSLPFIIIGAVLIGAILLALVFWRKGSGASERSPVAPVASNAAPVANGSSSQSQAAQNSEAPIVKPNVKVSSPVLLEEYGDYQCPPCGLLYPELKKIEAEYGNQLQIVFHHFPLTKMHKNALAAARAAEAARNQSKFWEMHDRLYRNQKAWADQVDPRPTFIGYAQELGLNVDKFTRDMDSPDVDQRINADIQRATSVGVNGTPTVFIEGQQLLYEATTPEGLRRGINLMLKRKAVT